MVRASDIEGLRSVIVFLLRDPVWPVCRVDLFFVGDAKARGFFALLFSPNFTGFFFFGRPSSPLQPVMLFDLRKHGEREQVETTNTVDRLTTKICRAAHRKNLRRRKETFWRKGHCVLLHFTRIIAIRNKNIRKRKLPGLHMSRITFKPPQSLQESGVLRGVTNVPNVPSRSTAIVIIFRFPENRSKFGMGAFHSPQ